ncbi:MAG TPA: CidA/LrgA family protein [Nocardioidaceae bacterium]|nr:CidA/LrgA family protein [Nocardioidaceae bacterium]
MLIGLIALLLCQLVGELVVRTFDVPLPGPIVGMVLMLVVLLVRRPRSGSGLLSGPQRLLRYLPLLYVPAGVGVVAHLSRLGSDAVTIAGGLVASWLAGLLVTAGVMALALRLSGARKVVR